MNILPCLLLACLSIGVQSFDGSELTELVDKKFEALLERIQVLEAKDADNKDTMAAMQASFSQREQSLMDQVSRLEHKYATDIAELTGNTEGDESQQKVTRRLANQPTVAFFATAPEYDLSRMATGQKITYAPPTTNIGNAFHHSDGEFVAPVKGDYMFIVTICGKLHTTNNFNVDHNGAIKAKLFIGPTIQQSTQSVILAMLPGDTVSVKSGRDNNGVFGSTYTSISGFLL